MSKFGGMVPGTVVHKGAALFPRIDIDKEMQALAALNPKKEEKAEKKEEPKQQPQPAEQKAEEP